MTMQDPIADMFSRIKNAQSMEKPVVTMPSSKLKVGIAKVLLSEGYILNFQLETDEARKSIDNEPTSSKGKGILIIYLKYYQGKPVIERLERFSRVSRRVYRKVKDFPRVMGFGIALISTSTQGVVSDRVAREIRQGGEVLGLVA